MKLSVARAKFDTAAARARDLAESGSGAKHSLLGATVKEILWDEVETVLAYGAVVGALGGKAEVFPADGGASPEDARMWHDREVKRVYRLVKNDKPRKGVLGRLLVDEVEGYEEMSLQLNCAFMDAWRR